MYWISPPGIRYLVIVLHMCDCTAAAAIPDWWIWMYWISPLSYAVRGILVNEMNTDDWSKQLEVEPGVSKSLGSFALESRGIQLETWCVMGWVEGHGTAGDLVCDGLGGCHLVAWGREEGDRSGV